MGFGYVHWAAAEDQETPVRSGLEGSVQTASIRPIKCFSELEELIVVAQHCGHNFEYQETEEPRQKRKDPWTLVDLHQADDLYESVDKEYLKHWNFLDFIQRDIEVARTPDFEEVLRLSGQPYRAPTTIPRLRSSRWC